MVATATSGKNGKAANGKTENENRIDGLMKSAPSAGPIQIQRIGQVTVRIPIIGTAPLLMAKFSDKSKRAMLEAMMGEKKIKQPKNPKQLFEDAQYRMGKGWGMPAVCFKAAIVGAARLFESKSLTMTMLKPLLYVQGDGSADDLVQLITKPPKMHEGHVRNANGGTDLRYRPLFEKWSAILQVRYVPSVITLDSVLALVDASGLGGVGDWRPSSPKCATGHFGTYQIDESKKIEKIESRSFKQKK